MNTYTSPYEIGIGDNVNYNFMNYQVLINYIKGETDAKGYTPKSNRTILIDNNDNRIVCDDYKQLIIEEAN
jgi:hypothetical protein